MAVPPPDRIVWKTSPEVEEAPPDEPSVDTRATSFPSDAVRPARDSPREIPFLRSHSTACSMSPWVSSSALLHSIMPA